LPEAFSARLTAYTVEEGEHQWTYAVQLRHVPSDTALVHRQEMRIHVDPWEGDTCVPLLIMAYSHVSDEMDDTLDAREKE
jgi:hypothetical protein